jgi:hypothetical protein
MLTSPGYSIMDETKNKAATQVTRNTGEANSIGMLTELK